MRNINFQKFESECELGLPKNMLYLESVPSVSEDDKLKYSTQCFRNLAKKQPILQLSKATVCVSPLAPVGA